MSETKRRAERTKPRQPGSEIDEAVRREIERRANERHRARGCAHGHDLDDWLAAEQEVLAERAAQSPHRRRPRSEP